MLMPAPASSNDPDNTPSVTQRPIRPLQTWVLRHKRGKPRSGPAAWGQLQRQQTNDHSPARHELKSGPPVR